MQLFMEKVFFDIFLTHIVFIAQKSSKKKVNDKCVSKKSVERL